MCRSGGGADGLRKEAALRRLRSPTVGERSAESSIPGLQGSSDTQLMLNDGFAAVLVLFTLMNSSKVAKCREFTVCTMAAAIAAACISS